MNAYRGEWRLKGEGSPRQAIEGKTFDEVRDLLEMVLANEYDCHEDFGVAAGYVAFEQKPFGHTVNGLEVSIIQLKGSKHA